VGLLSGIARIVVKAGRHDRRWTPVAVEIDESVPVAGLAPLDARARPGKEMQHTLPAQRDGRLVTFVVPRLKPGAELVLHTVPEVPKWLAERSATELCEDRTAVAILVGGKPFGSYIHGPELAKPCLWPVAGPGEISMTRSWPLAPEWEWKRDSRDHPHHKGLWVAHGDVNGLDFWGEGDGRGRIVHREFTRKVAGPVYAELAALNDWSSTSGDALCEEERTLRILRLGDDSRLVDLTARLRATASDLVLGDTKEAGLCAVRVASSMEKRCVIESSAGALGESECWGRPAHWVDYSGQAGGRHRGVAILDHPGNPRHPTRWHVREYGLFAANPFGLSDYKSGFERDGSMMVADGGELTFRYRVVLHKGNARGGRVRERWLDLAAPLTAEVAEA
jgi:hypothetical protein